MHSGPHEALKRIAAGDRQAGLEDLVVALRRFETREPGSGIEALCHLLDVYPDLRAALRTTLRELLGDASAAGLHAETGILANTGFFTELGRRLTGRLLPAPRDDSLRGQFGLAFDSGKDADWLERVSAAEGARLLDALGVAEDNPGAWQPARNALQDAVDLLSVRIAAMGVEPELLRHYRVPRSHSNPFLAQNALLQDWLANVRAGAQADTAEIDVLLTQCSEVIERVRRSARSKGASLSLTFLLRRLQQSLQRLATLLPLLDPTQSPASLRDRRWALTVELALAEGNTHDVREHFRESTEIVALLATENASRAGEHYITRTRAEYFAMFRAALGAGGIIGLMAVVKMGLASLHLPPLVEAFSFGLNYAAGFVLIYVLHFTIATKQPAMTAQTLAGSLIAGNTRRGVNADAIGLLVSRVARTQFVAVLGNVLLAAPVALVATWLLVWTTDSHVPAQKAPTLLEELHPLASPALFHAAIAGVWLFVAGLVNGYVDNLATYERLADRVRRLHWLSRFLGTGHRDRLAVWLEENIGGVAGNVFFGFALGMTGFVGAVLGLPLDIRHVTFAAANLAIALVGSEFALPLATVCIAALGVLLIALVNLAVSFALALWMALLARGRQIDDPGAVVSAIFRRLRRQPRSFLLPSRRGEDPTD